MTSLHIRLCADTTYRFPVNKGFKTTSSNIIKMEVLVVSLPYTTCRDCVLISANQIMRRHDVSISRERGYKTDTCVTSPRRP